MGITTLNLKACNYSFLVLPLSIERDTCERTFLFTERNRLQISVFTDQSELAALHNAGGIR